MNLANYGHNVRALRLGKGLSQRELAKRVGFTMSTISKAELSHNGVGLRLAALTAEALGVTVDTLIGPRLEAAPRLKPSMIQTHFAHNLRTVRKRKRLTQIQLGRLAGCSDGIVSQYERQTAPATESTASGLAAALGVSLETLTGPRLPPV